MTAQGKIRIGGGGRAEVAATGYKLSRRAAGPAFWRRLLLSLSGLMALPVLYFCAALIGAALPGPVAPIGGPVTTRIALARGPIHYDLLIPLTTSLRQRFAFAFRDGVPVFDPNARYLMVGWGARQFYTTSGSYADVDHAALWRAVSGDRATLHIDVAGDVSGVPSLTWLSLSDTQIAALTDKILSDLDLSPVGAPIPLDAHYGLTDAFYAARGDFHLFHTCNAWLGESLRAAGVPFGRWTPTPQAVDLALWLYG